MAKTRKRKTTKKPATEKKRRWKVNAETLNDFIDWKAEQEALLTETRERMQSQLNLRVEDMKEAAKVPEDTPVNLKGRYFVER